MRNDITAGKIGVQLKNQEKIRPRARGRGSHVVLRAARSSVRARAPVQLLLTAPSSSHPSLPPSFFKEVSRDKERSGASPHLQTSINVLSSVQQVCSCLWTEAAIYKKEMQIFFPAGLYQHQRNL